MKSKISVMLIMAMLLNTFATLGFVAEGAVGAGGGAAGYSKVIYSEDFNSYTDTEDFCNTSGWVYPSGNEGNMRIEKSLNNDTNNLSVLGKANFASVTFKPVALNDKGGVSPGQNAILDVECKVARTKNSDANANFINFCDSSVDMRYNNSQNGSIFTVGGRAPDAEYQWRYSANYSLAAKGIGLVPGNYAESANIWQKFRFSVKLTDETSNFVEPLVDVYVNDVKVLEGVSYTKTGTDAGNKLNCIRIYYQSSVERFLVDDISVKLTRTSPATPAPPVVTTKPPVETTKPPIYITASPIPANAEIVYKDNFEQPRLVRDFIDNTGWYRADGSKAAFGPVNANGTQFIKCDSQNGNALIKTFRPIQVSNGSGNNSANAVVYAEYKIMKGASNNNWNYLAFGDSELFKKSNDFSKPKGLVFAVGSLGNPNYYNWTFSSIFNAGVVTIPEASFPITRDLESEAVAKWYTVRYVMKITDKYGNYLPFQGVDVYLDGRFVAKSQYPLSDANKIDSIIINGNGSEEYKDVLYIDDVTVAYYSEPVPREPTPTPPYFCSTMPTTPIVTPTPKPIDVNKTILLDTIRDAMKVYFTAYSKMGNQPGQYLESVVSALMTEIIMAEGMLHTNVTQEQVDAEVLALKAAVKACVPNAKPTPAPTPKPDKSVLLTTLKQAMTLYMNVYTEVGTEPGQYLPEVVGELMSAMKYADHVYFDENVPVVKISAAIEGLESAMKACVPISAPPTSTPVVTKTPAPSKNPDKETLLSTLKSAISLHFSIHQEVGTEPGKYLQEVIDSLVDAMKYADDVFWDDNAAASDIAKAIDGLKAAMKACVPISAAPTSEPAVTKKPDGVKVRGYVKTPGARISIIKDSGNKLAANEEVSTIANVEGFFEFEGIQQGTYNAWITGANAIPRQMVINVGSEDVDTSTKSEKLDLYVGDLNGDNNINILDYVLFLACFGTDYDQDGYVFGVDYNSDGTINIIDYVSFLSNFGANQSYYN